MRPILASLCLLVVASAAPASAAPPDRTTRQNIEAASAGIAAAIDAPVQTSAERFAGKTAAEDPCFHDQFCQIYAADDIQVQATAWTVQALTSTRVAPRIYRSVCAGILAGLGDGAVHPELAAEAVGQAFQVASIKGRFEADVGGVEMTVKPDLGGTLLECSFWRRW